MKKNKQEQLRTDIVDEIKNVGISEQSMEKLFSSILSVSYFLKKYNHTGKVVIQYDCQDGGICRSTTKTIVERIL